MSYAMEQGGRMNPVEIVESERKIHDLKIQPEYFLSILNQDKRFEIRFNDRDYRVGDLLVLRECDSGYGDYTGKSVIVRVTYMFKGIGLLPGYCIMSIVPHYDG